MAIHERDLFDFDDDRPWPKPGDDHHFTDGCPQCDATRFVIGLEHDLRMSSLDLWIAGWSPDDLLDEVRRSTGRREATDLMAHVLIVDDSFRSEQARPADWCSVIARLRAATGVDDVATGWLARWVALHPDRPAAAEGLETLVRVVMDLVEPSAAA